MTTTASLAVSIHHVTAADIGGAWYDQRDGERANVSFSIGKVGLYFDSIADLHATLAAIVAAMNTEAEYLAEQQRLADQAAPALGYLTPDGIVYYANESSE